MKYATTADLRDNLSAYLREVEGGEHIVVLRRDRPVAELVPPRPEVPASRDADLDERVRHLERTGFLRKGPRADEPWPDWLLAAPKGPSSGVLGALLEEREESPW